MESLKLGVIRLKHMKGGLYNPLLEKLRDWILGMVWVVDNENGPDFWCWIEQNHIMHLDDDRFDTFFVVDLEKNEILATGSVVADDRDAGKRYDIEGIWFGGVNVRPECRNRPEVIRLLRKAVEEHVSKTNKTITLNLFAQDGLIAEYLRRSCGYKPIPKDDRKPTSTTGDGTLWIMTGFPTDQWALQKVFDSAKRAKRTTRRLNPYSFTVKFESAEADTFLPRAEHLECKRLKPGRRYESNSKVPYAVFFANFIHGDTHMYLFHNQIDRHNYYEKLNDINPSILKLIELPQHMTIQLSGSQERRKYDCGIAHGYSCVIPCNNEAFRFFANDKADFSPYRMGDGHILSKEKSIGCSEYLFIESFGHIPSLKRAELNWDALRHLFSHIAEFLPPMELSEDGKRVTLSNINSAGELPRIFSYAVGATLRERYRLAAILDSWGFLVDKDPANFALRYNDDFYSDALLKFQFLFSDFNSPNTSLERKSKMRNTIKLLVQCIKQPV